MNGALLVTHSFFRREQGVGWVRIFACLQALTGDASYFPGTDSRVRERTLGRSYARRIVTNPQPTIEDAVTLHV
jgi:hypothetical protein